MTQFPCPSCGAARASLTADCPACAWRVPPARTVRDLPPPAASPISLIVLLGALLWTLACATLNTVEEGYPLLSFVGSGLILLAGLSQVPGILIAVWHWKTRAGAAVPLLCGAWIIAFTGAAVYAKYASDGRADSLNSAAHLHVIAFPVFHGLFALLVYLLCGLVAVLGLRRRRKT